jgi:trans-aconitate 2-methyltransferase
MTHEDIIEWDKGTGARPYLDSLPDDGLRDEFLKEYLEAVKKAYPCAGENGKILMPFTRIFFTAAK